MSLAVSVSTCFHALHASRQRSVFSPADHKSFSCRITKIKQAIKRNSIGVQPGMDQKKVENAGMLHRLLAETAWCSNAIFPCVLMVEYGLNF
jgi:hypothetical protein